MIQKVFIQEKRLKTKLRGILNLPYSHLPLPSSMIALKTNSLTTMVAVKMSSLADTGRVRKGLELLQSLITRELSLLELSFKSLKSSILRLCFDSTLLRA